jgi:guanosine-3',5'-bis(diphosphate) 3'-pyrophosphohydrolase
VRQFTRWHTWAETEPELREYTDDDTVTMVGKAVRFAGREHGAQQRLPGVPYLEHLLETLEILVVGVGVTDTDVLQAAVLHDVVEDTPATATELEAEFGPRVAELVGWVTKPEPRPGEDPATAKEAYLAGLRHAPRDAVLVKLADRASNVQTLRNLPPARQRSYYAQTVRFIVPLAATVPWFAAWYADWQREFSDLG